MTTTEVILNYVAQQGGIFHQKELLVAIDGKDSVVNKRAMDLQLSRMVESGLLRRKKRGVYQLMDNSLPELVY